MDSRMDITEKQGLLSAKLLALFSYVTDDNALSMDNTIDADKVAELLDVIEKAVDKVKDAVIAHVSEEGKDKTMEAKVNQLI